MVRRGAFSVAAVFSVYAVSVSNSVDFRPQAVTLPSPAAYGVTDVSLGFFAKPVIGSDRKIGNSNYLRLAGER
jgi:hypothetical protein